MSAIKISIEHEGRKAEIEIPLELIKEMARKQDKNEAISRTKQLPKIGEENRSTFPIMEVAKIKPKISGIKEKTVLSATSAIIGAKMNRADIKASTTFRLIESS